MCIYVWAFFSSNRGRVVATLQSENMSLENVSDYMWQAVIASEDRRFFR